MNRKLQMIKFLFDYASKFTHQEFLIDILKVVLLHRNSWMILGAEDSIDGNIWQICRSFNLKIF